LHPKFRPRGLNRGSNRGIFSCGGYDNNLGDNSDKGGWRSGHPTLTVITLKLPSQLLQGPGNQGALQKEAAAKYSKQAKTTQSLSSVFVSNLDPD
jgi:hypothetical protein